MKVWLDARLKRRATADAENIRNIAYFRSVKRLAKVLTGGFRWEQMRVMRHLNAKDGRNEWMG